jgi:hypothetical protein
MFPILPRHLYLVEPRVSIYEKQKITPRGGVHDLIDTWEWIWVFGACLIEAGVVNALLKLPVCLGDNDRVGQPLEVVDLVDKASVQQLADLFTYEVLPLDGLL